jgi:hypothetical protein
MRLRQHCEVRFSWRRHRRVLAGEAQFCLGAAGPRITNTAAKDDVTKDDFN